MSVDRGDRIRKTISALNAIEVGELAAIEGKLKLAGAELAGLEQPGLEALLLEAGTALGRGDISNFRRLVAQTVSRLGHLR